jgi:hypothetical protein
MTTEMGPTGKLMWLGLVVLALFSGLCTIFVLVATAAQTWQEHAQARWPEVTAHVDSCGLTRTSTNWHRQMYIQCRLGYTIGAEQDATNVFSSNFPAPEIWQNPPNQIAPFEEWVDEHPQGTPIVVRYDPANHKKVFLAADYMPHGGPRTASNLKLLEVCAGSFLVLLTIARITRPQFLLQNAYSSMPLNP